MTILYHIIPYCIRIIVSHKASYQPGYHLWISLKCHKSFVVTVDSLSKSPVDLVP